MLKSIQMIIRKQCIGIVKELSNNFKILFFIIFSCVYLVGEEGVWETKLTLPHWIEGFVC